MKIEDLRKIRNKNVQQQNQLEYLEMKECSESYRNCPTSFPWLNELLKKKGQSIATGILLSVSDIPEQGGMQWMGTWLTNDRKFFEFDIMAEYSSNFLIDVDEWIEVHPTIKERCKGTGKSSAYLALELLDSIKK